LFPGKETVMKRFLLVAAMATMALVGLSANKCSSEQPQQQAPEQQPPQQQSPAQ
jgi:hypothetical protein